MKFIITLVLIILLSFCACLYFPWWSIAIVAFIVSAIIPLRPYAAFLAGFFALLLLWGGVSWWISNGNEDILAHRVSLLILKNDTPVLLIILTAFIGAIVGGFAALAGSYVRPKVRKV
ncbi:MAG: hypothetical protein ABI266_06765 [Ginsengibacter sp.]